MSRKATRQCGSTKRNIAAAAALAALCLLTGAMNAGAQTAKIKCWKNHEGVRECGSFVPPEYSQKGFEVKSTGGVTLERKAQARSVEDVEAEREQRRAAAAAAAAARLQAVKDQVLLDTFSSEDDMIFARDGQIAHLESQVKITGSHIKKLKKSLDELIQEAAGHERRGKQPPAKLVADISSLREQIADNEKFIETKAVERKGIEEKFERDIARFRNLKGLEKHETASAD